MGNIQGNHRYPLRTSFFLLRFSGLWSHSDDSSTLKRIIYSIYSMMMTSLIWIFIGTILGDIFCNFQDLMIITDDGCFLAGISIVIFKHLIFCIRRGRIIKLFHDIYHPIDNLAKSSDEGVRMLVKVYTFYDNLTYYTLVSIGSSLLLALVTIVPTENGSLPIRAQYPFDSASGALHNVALVIQAGAVATGVAGIIGMDGSVTSSTRYIALQLAILESNYRHCQTKWPRGDFHPSIEKQKNQGTEIHCFVPFSQSEADEANDSFVKRFKICIRHHQRLINIVDNMNTVYGSSMFVQLCASSSMICFAGFQVALVSILGGSGKIGGFSILKGARGSANLIKFGLYCGTAFAQLLAWCLIGNMLLHQSLTLNDGQWQSGWEDEHYIDFAYLMIFSMVRGNRSLQLKAINFYSMSMDTFVAILRSSYSLFSLLVAAL